MPKDSNTNVEMLSIMLDRAAGASFKQPSSSSFKSLRAQGAAQRANML